MYNDLVLSILESFQVGIFSDNRRLPEISFKLEKEFEEEVYRNSKLLFGEKSILLDTKTLLKGDRIGGTIPDGFLFDLSNTSDPQFYLIEVELAKHSFHSHIFPQITKFFAFKISLTPFKPIKGSYTFPDFSKIQPLILEILFFNIAPTS